jgi:hypothetical protein
MSLKNDLVDARNLLRLPAAVRVPCPLRGLFPYLTAAGRRSALLEGLIGGFIKDAFGLKTVLYSVQPEGGYPAMD